MATAWPWCARFRARFEPMTAMPTTPMSAVAVVLSADAVAVSVIGAPSLAAVGSTLARAPRRSFRAPWAHPGVRGDPEGPSPPWSGHIDAVRHPYLSGTAR